MKKLVLAILLVPLGLWAQDQNPTSAPRFTLDSKAIGLSGGGTSVPATDVGATFALTDHLAIRSDNILIADNGNSGPSGPAQIFLAGVQYYVPAAWLVKHTKIDPKKFQLYVVGQLGVSRSSLVQELAGSAGGGANYDPTGSGKFIINLFEVRWIAKAPVGDTTQVSNAIMYGTGFKISF
jgi:hypothetical protein